MCNVVPQYEVGTDIAYIIRGFKATPGGGGGKDLGGRAYTYHDPTRRTRLPGSRARETQNSAVIESKSFGRHGGGGGRSVGRATIVRPPAAPLHTIPLPSSHRSPGGSLVERPSRFRGQTFPAAHRTFHTCPRRHVPDVRRI